MKRTIMGAMVLSLAVGSLALAQGYDQQQRHEEHQHAAAHHHAVAHAHSRFVTGRYVRPRGYYAHTWRRGDRLPPAYRGSAYVIPNAAAYHLRPAPRGYYWVRVDNNAVLAAVATGVVVDIAANLFH